MKGRQSGPILYAPHWRDAQLRDGTIFAARTGYRPQPAIFVNGCQDIRLHDITIHFAEGTPLLHAISTDGILWRDNRIEPTRSYPKFHPNQKRFLFESCRNIDIAPSDTIQ